MYQEDIETFNRKTRSEGVKAASQFMMDALGVEVKDNSCQKWKISNSEPVILVGLNHETIVEPFAITSLIGREKMKFIANYGLTNWVDRKILIPVIARRYAIDRPMTLKRIGERWADIFRPLNRKIREKKFTLAVIEKNNTEAFKEAENELNKNGMVMIYPTGGGDRNKPWARGIGELISGLINNKKSGAQLVVVEVKGVNIHENNWRIVWRAITGRTWNGKMKTEMEITKVIKIGDHIKRWRRMNAVEVATDLERLAKSI